MTDELEAPNGTELSLEQLAEQFNAFRENSKAEMTALRAEISRLRGISAGSGPDTPTLVTEQDTSSTQDDANHDVDASGHVSRRGALLALGGAAAGGVGMAIGSAFIGAEPAAATTGTMSYGTTNNAGTDITALITDTVAEHVGFFVQNTGTDSFGLYGVVIAESGIDATPGSGVVGDTSGTGAGVQGISNGGIGVYGITAADGNYGVLGSDISSGGGAGVTGTSNSGYGVFGAISSSGAGQAGVYGRDEGTGVDNFGIAGVSFYGRGVSGQSSLGTGVFGASSFASGVGVRAQNTAGPSLQLDPFGTSTLPSTGSPGQFIVLADGSLHYCNATDHWTTVINGVVTIPAVRVIDTTTGVGGITGPLIPGSTVYTSGPIAGSNGIPANATIIFGNFAISGVDLALLNGYGVATIFPAGESPPATANINAGAGCYAISNAVTVGLGVGGALSILWGGGGPVPNAEAFLDVTGYVI